MCELQSVWRTKEGITQQIEIEVIGDGCPLSNVLSADGCWLMGSMEREIDVVVRGEQLGI